MQPEELLLPLCNLTIIPPLRLVLFNVIANSHSLFTAQSHKHLRLHVSYGNFRGRIAPVYWDL